jgi:hypothetical protein
MSNIPDGSGSRLRKTDLRLDLVTPPQERSSSLPQPGATDPPAGISQEEIDILWRAPQQGSRQHSER